MLHSSPNPNPSARVEKKRTKEMSAAAVDRALYALAPPGGGTVLRPAVWAALPRALLAAALVLVSAWVLGLLGGLATQPRVVRWKRTREKREREEEKVFE